MPRRNVVPCRICASSRVSPKNATLNAEGVLAGAGDCPGFARVHIPITGNALLCENFPDSYNAFTITESVRLACAENWKKSAVPYPLSVPPQFPEAGTCTGDA